MPVLLHATIRGGDKELQTPRTPKGTPTRQLPPGQRHPRQPDRPSDRHPPSSYQTLRPRPPGYRLHPLKGNMEGFWSIRVSANWRIVFRMEGVHVYDVDLLDYHN